MQKRLKITLYIILILIVIAVIWLMFGHKNIKTNTPIESNMDEISTGEELIDNDEGNTINLEDTDTFENDVMNDLEGFFNDNNGYEDVQGEFGFINADGE